MRALLLTLALCPASPITPPPGPACLSFSVLPTLQTSSGLGQDSTSLLCLLHTKGDVGLVSFEFEGSGRFLENQGRGHPMAPHVLPTAYPYLLNPFSTTWIPPLPTCPSTGDQPQSTNSAQEGKKNYEGLGICNLDRAVS